MAALSRRGATRDPVAHVGIVDYTLYGRLVPAATRLVFRAKIGVPPQAESRGRAARRPVFTPRIGADSYRTA